MTDTIFMIHGMWGGPWCWEKYRGVFEAAGFHCVAPMLPYHEVDPGGLPHPRLATAGLLEYAEAIEREVRRLPEKPVVMGHSMGGLLAQMIGARGLASALVLLTPAAPAGIPAVGLSTIRSFWSIQTTWGFWRKPIRQTFSEAVYSALHLMPEAERKETYERFGWESGRAAFEIGYWPFDPQGAARVDASKVTCPVLVIAGARDRMTPPSVVRRIARKYRAVATYREFENHAHWIVSEPGWEAVAGDVLEWIHSTV